MRHNHNGVFLLEHIDKLNDEFNGHKLRHVSSIVICFDHYHHNVDHLALEFLINIFTQHV